MNEKKTKPEWLKKRIKATGYCRETEKLLTDLSLHTVCDSAICPNKHECYSQKTSTFMILGTECTRQCRFCAVSKGKPVDPDPDEPSRIGVATLALGLRHVVITSVTRDDLSDGGASHYAKTIREIRKLNPGTTIELLIPDLAGNWDAMKIITDEHPDILNHNLETIKRLYGKVRPQADYHRSLSLLSKVKEFDPTIRTKSGIMVGLGETTSEIHELMDHLRLAGCDLLTIGQYLRPSDAHLEVESYIHPDIFAQYESTALRKGFAYAACGVFVRSSYNAADGMTALLAEKEQKGA